MVLCIFLFLLPGNVTPARAQSTGSPLPPYLGWTVAADGAPYLLDARYVLWELDPATLAPVRRSSPLLPVRGSRPMLGFVPAHLVATDDHIWVGAEAMGGTEILERSTFTRRAATTHYGAMAAGPDGEVYLIDGRGLHRFAGDLARDAAQTLLTVPPPGAYPRAYPLKVTVDPVDRRLFLTIYNAVGSPPHNRESLLVTDLDPFKLEAIDTNLGSYSRPVLTADGELMAVGFNAKNGAFGSWVGLWQQGEWLVQASQLYGQVTLDPQGEWLYLLNDRGLWVFRLPDMALASMLPLSHAPFTALDISPDGQALYLFGRTLLTALPVEELQSPGFPVLTSLPGMDMVRRYRTFASPTRAKDATTFAVDGSASGPDPYGLLISQDNRRTWTATEGPNVDWLSISPGFDKDGTVVAAADGTDLLVRSTDGGAEWQPWTPPIAYTAEIAGWRQIMRMEMADGSTQPLTTANADSENAAWSPAWTYIAFQSNRSGNWEIYTIRADCDVAALGEEECDLRQLTDDPADDMLPAWSPDGRQIAFVSTRAGNADIYVLTLADGAVQRVTDDPAGDWRPAWLPDSQQLIFTSARAGNNDLYVVGVPRANDSTYPARAIIATPADERDPAVSIKGGLAFASDYSGKAVIYKVAPWSLWGEVMVGLSLKENINAYSRGAKTEHIDGAHPAWNQVESWNLLFARQSEKEYGILRGDVYTTDSQEIVSATTFVGHPATGPVFWFGERE
jgi:hypothetical protein